MFDCITIGDCTFDVNLFLYEATVECKLDRESCKLCLGYGEKIPIDKISRGLGGNAANNAVGLKRLGLKVGFYAIFGDDQIGERIGQFLDVQGVDKTFVRIEKGTESRYSTIINFAGERTILVYSIDRKYQLIDGLEKTAWIYLSGVGPEYEKFFGELANFVAEKGLKLAFAPTVSQFAKDRGTYQSILGVSQVIFLNKEEAMRMTNYELRIMNYGQEEIKKLLFAVRDLGPKIVVITDGKNGSYCYDGVKYYFLGILDRPVVQVTGAGDAYASGFLAATMSGLARVEAMRWGTVNAAAVVSTTEGQTGLLTKTEMQTILEENSSLRAKEI